MTVGNDDAPVLRDDEFPATPELGPDPVAAVSESENELCEIAEVLAVRSTEAPAETGEEAHPSAGPEATDSDEETTAARLDALASRFDTLDGVVADLAKQIALLPAQGRRLAGKVDGLTTSVSDSRLRPVFLGVIGILDIAERARTMVGTEGGDRRLWDAVVVQLRQLLELNGLTEIPTDGAFDPRIHRAMDTVPVDDPDLDDCVIATLRAGFRSDHVVLRSAEVCLGRYAAPAPVPPGDKPVSEKTPGTEAMSEAPPSPDEGVDSASPHESDPTPAGEPGRSGTEGTSHV